MGLSLPNAPLFTNIDLRNSCEKYDPNLVTRWQQQQKTEKVRNGLYLQSSHEIHGYWDWFCLAYQMYVPNYISLVSALRLYNFIPESVYAVTAVTTRKTKKFHFRNKLFRYHHISEKFYFGYLPEEWRGLTFYLASPEKAILDTVYLDSRYSDPDWIHEMRFDYDEMNEQINRETLNIYTDYYDSKVVRQRIDLIFKAMDGCLH